MAPRVGKAHTDGATWSLRSSPMGYEDLFTLLEQRRTLTWGHAGSGYQDTLSAASGALRKAPFRLRLALGSGQRTPAQLVEEGRPALTGHSREVRGSAQRRSG